MNVRMAWLGRHDRGESLLQTISVRLRAPARFRGVRLGTHDGLIRGGGSTAEVSRESSQYWKVRPALKSANVSKVGRRRIREEQTLLYALCQEELFVCESSE